MIQIENLTKNFGPQRVLDMVNLKFERGSVYGIVGENGAGKTTLFRCIAGLESFSGQITSDLNKLKDKLGLLPAEPYFFLKITGKEYLTLLTRSRRLKINKMDQINIFDLPLDQYASTYSTGMKKKLALMAILLQENEVFILDEPFNGVDIQSNMLITELIRKLKSLNKTILISSHIFSTLADTCDSIILLHKGKIIKGVQKPEFSVLEEEMKKRTVGNRVEQLGLG